MSKVCCGNKLERVVSLCIDPYNFEMMLEK
jgi:hypothetical protein